MFAGLTFVRSVTHTPGVTRSAPQFVYAEIGRRIRRARISARLSQVQLADEAGVSRATLVNIERGRHRIQIHVLIEIARALRVQFTDLVILSAEPTPLPPQFAKKVSQEGAGAVARLLAGPEATADDNEVD